MRVGADATERAAHTSAALFSGEVAGLDADQLADATADVPTATVAPAALAAGIDVVDLLVDCGLAPSKGQARRLVGEGAVSVNGARFDGERPLGTDDLLAGEYLLLRRGKRQWGAVRAVQP